MGRTTVVCGVEECEHNRVGACTRRVIFIGKGGKCADNEEVNRERHRDTVSDSHLEPGKDAVQKGFRGM